MHCIAAPSTTLSALLGESGFRWRRASFRVSAVPLAGDHLLDALRAGEWNLWGGDFDVV